jgi:ABC-type uncharacterized transport system permease subunit
LPASPVAFAASLIALLISFLLSGALTTLLGVSCLWLEGRELAQLVPVFAWVSSGLVLPLSMPATRFPDSAEWLLFVGIFAAPLRLYSGNGAASQAAFAVVRGLGWHLGLRRCASTGN